MAVAAVAKVAFTAETLQSAAKQSEGIHLIPLSLRRAIKKYLTDRGKAHMNRKVLLLSQSFNIIKDVNLQLSSTASRELIEDPLKSINQRAGRWKIRSNYGDIGLTYGEDETVAYVASRMPAVYSAIYRVLKEVRRRLPGFNPSKVLDFGSGPGSALWAMREVWPRSLQQVNLVEPSKEMQRAAQSLLREDQFESELDEESQFEDSLVPYASDVAETNMFHEADEEVEEDEARADVGGGWGRIIYMPVRRGRQIQMDVCRSTKRDGSEGAFHRVVVTKSKNPTLHHQARRSLWGDL